MKRRLLYAALTLAALALAGWMAAQVVLRERDRPLVAAIEARFAPQLARLAGAAARGGDPDLRTADEREADARLFDRPEIIAAGIETAPGEWKPLAGDPLPPAPRRGPLARDPAPGDAVVEKVDVPGPPPTMITAIRYEGVARGADGARRRYALAVDPAKIKADR
jgi:hypothetical protein